jgi:outer membrane protein assembly factor BamA
MALKTTADGRNASSQFSRILLSISICLVFMSIGLAQDSRKIARIEAEGLQTLTSNTVIATSGLKTGEVFSLAAVDAAAQRLIDSGLFKKVGYRTSTVGGAVTIVFQLEEVKGNRSPVVFDNFIWFSDEELATAVKSVVPTFDGSAPDTGDTTLAIKKALQDLLLARKLPGTVEYMLTETAHQFSVAGVPMKICSLHFPGSRVVSEQKLIETTRASMDGDYSRESARTFPKYGLFPLYRELGHLRASFGAPVAKPDTSGGCEGGVDLTIPVTEGSEYSWARAEWSGNQVLTATELDGALGMKTGEVANGLKFDKRLREVDKAYGKHGHIMVSLRPEPEFDDASQKVTYRIAITEGPQFRMGAIEFRGVSAEDRAALKKKWKLQSGAIYDQSYNDRFFKTDAAQLLSRISTEWQAIHKKLPVIRTMERPVRESLTVNVTIEIKN